MRIRVKDKLKYGWFLWGKLQRFFGMSHLLLLDMCRAWDLIRLCMESSSVHGILLVLI